MDRFYIDKLVVSGSNHKSSVIDFNVGLNLIIGPSNTGKSLVMDCIDYAFGFTPKVNRPSKIVDNNNGYEVVTLHLKTASGTVILERKIADTKITVSGTDPSIEHDSYSVGSNAKKSINSIFLSLLGIDDEHKVLSSESGSTQKVTWRSMLHLFFMRQPDVAREASALMAPGAIGKTASPAVLLYLLTGQDANNLEKPEDPEISKAKKKALMVYIRDKAERLTIRREELEELLATSGDTNIQKVIKEIRKEIADLRKKLDAASLESQKLMSEIYEQNGKLSECNTVVHNFSVLHQQYQSDIRRLGFIVDGKLHLSNAPAKKHCPFCDSEITMKPTPQYIDASAAELDKIKMHLSELLEAQRSIDKQKAVTVENIRVLETRKGQIDSLISDQLLPQLSAFQEQLEKKLYTMQLTGELGVIRQNEIQYRSELFEKETEETPENPKYNIFGYYDYELVHGFEKKLIEVLKTSKIGGATTARLNMKNFDLEINNLNKAVSMGGGFCGILNTIIAYTMSAYIIEKGGKAPGFFASDSSLTQLSEAEHILQGDTIKQNFVQYLVNHALERQVIMVEQKKRMPFIPKEDYDAGIHIIEFSRNKSEGRYGFLNEVFNPEDQ
ncbi:MAG: AAA family ATPase [Anaerovoracaceae bacterium]